jgi:3-oxoacyl-(acyl-carrier-protein) synthase
MGQSKPSHRFTGLGVVSAAGQGLAATRANLLEGRQLPRATDPSEPRFFKIAADLPLAETDYRCNTLALTAALEAINQAGLTSLEGLRVGVCVGSTVGCTNYQETWQREYFDHKFPGGNPFARGPVQMLSNACTSGADAIGVGANWLDADLCDLVLCGGTEEVLERIFYGFRSLMLVAPGPCQPFDVRRKGLNLGEGAGILVLEKFSSPRPSRGELLGYGCGSDAYHPTSPDPEAGGLDRAVAQTGADLRSVDFINAHATGTPHNDLAEGVWIRKNTPQARVVATKGYTGHTLGAAGAIEAILTLMSLESGKLPVSRGFGEIDPDIGIEPTRAVEAGHYKSALSLSLGFGGINSALHLGAAQ